MEVASSALGLLDTCLKLFDKLQTSYKKHKNIHESVELLRQDLVRVKEAIETTTSVPADLQHGMRSWIADLKEIWQMIQDAVEIYNFEVTIKRNQEGFRVVVSAVKDVFVGPEHNLLKNIQKIKTKMEEAAIKQKAFSHPHENRITRAREEEQAGQGSVSAPYQHPKEAHPEGLDEPKAKVIQMLSGPHPDGLDSTLRIIAIFGPGGSGKSVLAAAVYKQIKEDIECTAWVTASHDVNDLLGDILDQMRLSRPPPSINLSEYLRGLLQKKRYIIVIDGLDTTCYWNDILHACPDDNMSSIVIVTTVKEKIARICHKNCPIPVYKMLPLDKSSARALLIRKVCSNNLAEEALTKILETCEYLPVAIANMGDHFRSVKEWDYAMCEQACNNIGSLLVNHKKEEFLGMNHVLNRSYTSLDANAKTLLLLLNTCPIDQVIKRKSLIRRWLAESRLIACTLNQSAEHLANECFNALIENNFILPVKFSINGKVKTFRVHRMMLQFIKDKAIFENFVTCFVIQPNRNVEPNANIHRLFLHNSSSESPAIGRKENDLSRVRLLALYGKASSALMGSIISILLRVLILENIENMTDDHLETICRPSMLRYLSIRGSRNVSMLPKKIRTLQYLETLDTRNTNVGKIQTDLLPPYLVHLFGEFQILCESQLPTKLQTLAGFYIDESEDFVKLLPGIPMLSKVRILCRNTAPSTEVIDVLLASLNICFNRELSQKNIHLRSLTIDFNGVNGSIDFMDDLEVPSVCFLQSLKLCGNLTILPRFILTDCLIELCLTRTNIGANVLVQLESMKNLQFLKLTEDSLFGETEKTFTWRKGWFMKLKRLCFVVQKLPTIVIEEKAMESLESLQLLCGKLGGFSGIKYLLRLEELILPCNVIGKETDDLSRMVSEHPMRPKFLRPPADANGPNRPGPTLVRSKRLSKTMSQED